MKLVRCEWAPSLVVEWLCGELEERGIPGPTYAHTLLSLLHHHYCPHPAPPTPIATTCSSNISGRYHHPLSRRYLDDFDLRDLDLDDLLGHTPHPDADLPDIASFTAQQRGGSRRARKRHKVRQKQRVLTSEQLQKVAAIQCLMSASDERYDLENLVEELCTRLKTAAENKHHNVENNTLSRGKKDKVDELADLQESCNESEEYASSSTPEEQAEKYYAAFPPLSGACKENCTHEEIWKSGDALCSCVWEGRKLQMSLPTASTKMPRTFRKKCRDKEKRKEMEGKSEGKDICDVSRRHHVSFTWHSASKHKEAIMNESYDTDSASEAERGVERRRKRFVGPLLDEDIGEGYIGDTSSRESSEDRDKGEQEPGKLKDDRNEKGSSGISSNKVKISQEEWECMGEFLIRAVDSDGSKIQEGCGNRLFERGSTSGGTSGSSSDIETFAVTNLDQDAESVRQLERKISDSVAQVWGQAGESLGHGRGEHVWDPPATQELTFYTTIWGFERPNQYVSKETIGVFQSSELHDSQGSVLIEDHLPLSCTRWDHKRVWESDKRQLIQEDPLKHPLIQEDPLKHPLIQEDPLKHQLIQEDPLLCSITSESSPNEAKDCNTENALFHMNSQLEKSVWSDCNANDICGAEGTPACREGLHVDHIVTLNTNNCPLVSDIENSLCESYLKLGLENLWENTLGLESIFADLSLSNNNAEHINENHSVEDVPNNPTDSEHEKMMALVEDVCKSYESQEENAAEGALKPLPIGPSGPQADLKHTESSGFSMVVPRSKSEELQNSIDQMPESISLSLDNSMSHAGNSGNMDTLPTGQEEENLLTSPRTHFRPIRQESLGSTADDHYEDGTMFVINSERPDLPFQRTSSGALFLESDLLEGSPKKYMVYKEPAPKIIHTEDEPEPVSTENIIGIALVPKFKVVNNEKFCQTEEESGAPLPNRDLKWRKNSSQEKIIYVDRLMCNDDKDQDPDVFEFQNHDFPEESGLARLWRNDPHSSEVSQARNIWQIKVDGGHDTWSLISDLEQTGGASSQGAWHDKDSDAATAWSKEDPFQTSLTIENSRKSGAMVIPSSLASLWHHTSPPSSPPNSTSDHRNLEALWAGFKPPYNEESSLDNKSSRMYIITNPNTHIPGKMQDSCHVMSLSEVGTWKQFSTTKDCNQRDNLCKEKLLRNSQNTNHKNAEVMEENSRTLSLDQSSENPALCTKLRLEVDQEADELLGAVHAQTVNDITQSCMNAAVFSSNSFRELSCNSSPRPLHERMKKSSNFISGQKRDQVHHTNKEVGEQQEDLDDLAPGWEFNDGFEWEHQPSLLDEEEDGADFAFDDDDGEGGELLVYETADGTTFTIPVEYLDDSLYDQIFGTTPSDNQALGGSLPDLPSGHPNKIHFSSELEEEWKKSGIPYKVQLPRKHRPGRWLPPSRRPCTFFMEGSCRRNDCKFSHDLASITCRFWEEGSCLKGITCPFLHGYPVRRRRNKSEGAAYIAKEKRDHHGSGFEIDSEMDFPTLGSSCESKSGFTEERISASGGGSYHRSTAKKKKRKFIAITKNVLGEGRSAEAERALRRRLHTRRERRRRNTHVAAGEGGESTVPSTATNASSKPRNTNSRRLAERHRASASGHDDGTVSDY
ncbi:hypothetical protein SK128_009487 [Halocaridina rubra]|uniref:C3H1-type domain-containing protein n=1 Tax=Halocaridina rubra TaxID=373956 RepID=A0AAN8XAC7_HALRR